MIAPKFGKAAHLAVTVGLEHWTGILAQVVLEESSVWTDARQNYGMIWRWHAFEETEVCIVFSTFKYNSTH